MASNTLLTQQEELEWFLQTQTNLEWTKWWAEVEPNSGCRTIPEPNINTFAFPSTFPPNIDWSSFPVVSPASTSNTSEQGQTETSGQTSDHDEVKAKRRKQQNREAQRKCRDRRREQVMNLGERLRNSMAENKNLQAQYTKLKEEYERLKSENGVYFELLQTFWSSNDMTRVGSASNSKVGRESWDWSAAQGRL